MDCRVSTAAPARRRCSAPCRARAARALHSAAPGAARALPSAAPGVPATATWRSPSSAPVTAVASARGAWKMHRDLVSRQSTQIKKATFSVFQTLKCNMSWYDWYPKLLQPREFPRRRTMGMQDFGNSLPLLDILNQPMSKVGREAPPLALVARSGFSRYIQFSVWTKYCITCAA